MTIAAIRGGIEAQGLPRDMAVFELASDGRFVSLSGARWTYRRELTPEQLDVCHDRLVWQHGAGLTLQDLVTPLFHVDASWTDAEACLSSDPRFLQVDGRWYAADAIQQLTPEQVDRLHEALLALSVARVPVSSAVLLRDTLGIDALLTDCDVRLAHDSRFLQVHPGFWAPPDFQPPFVYRGRWRLPRCEARQQQGMLGQPGPV